MMSRFRLAACAVGGMMLASSVLAVWAIDTPLDVVLPLSSVAVGLSLTGALLLWSWRRRMGRVAATLVSFAVVGMVLYAGPLRVRHESLEVEHGDVMLRGTLFVPRWSEPIGGVVLVHGSGPETHEEYAFYAHRLARAGFAAIAYDKRGAGKSSGTLFEATYHHLAADVVAAVEHLREREIESVGLVGFSEAEWVAPLAAAEADVAFLVVIGASGLSPAEQVAEEIEVRLRSRGFQDKALAGANALWNKVAEYQRTGRGREALQNELDRVRDQPWFQAAEDLPYTLAPASEYAWWRSVMDFDPARAWQSVQAPTLILEGELDDRSNPLRRPRRLEKLLPRDSCTRIVRFEGADHMLLVWPLGTRTPPPVFAPGYLDLLVTWTAERARAKRCSTSTARMTNAKWSMQGWQAAQLLVG